MTEGKVVTWLKQPGDAVAKGEPLVVVESDKADMDVESFDAGIVAAIVVNEGGVASVGVPIAYIAESEADVAAAKEKAAASGGNGAAVRGVDGSHIRSSRSLNFSCHLGSFLT